MDALFFIVVLLVIYVAIGVMLMNACGLDLLLWDWYTDEMIGGFGLMLRLLCWPYIIYNHFNG